jgi:uncharacterized membrane protein YecN with MAPEG domain
LPFAGKNTQVSTFRRRIFTEIPQNNFSSGLLLTSSRPRYPMKTKMITHGILTGVVVTIYMALLYAAGIKYLSNWWLTVLMYPIIIGLLCYFTSRLKTEFPDQPFGFQQTFIAMLSMSMIATLVSTIWNIILFNAIDTTLAKELTELILVQTRDMMEKWGAPDDSIKQTLKEMKDLPSQFKPLAQLKSWLSGGIFLAIISLICAAFLKRKNQTNPFQA